MIYSSDLSPNERLRYSRHLILPEVGLDGQKRLKAAKVLVVGTGGLGSPCSLYLAAAGVGTLGIADFDAVDFSNLQRQILFSTDAVGKSKVQTAAERLRSLNNEINVVTHEDKLSARNALAVLGEYDIVIDGTDNFETRYLINDACVILRKPNVHGAIFRFEGQLSVFFPPQGPCYRCLFPSPPPPESVPNCAEGGVLGVLAGTIGVMQATEAMKLILQLGSPLIGKLVVYDALAVRFETLKIARNKDCPMCGEQPTITALLDEVVACGVDGPDIPQLTARELQTLLSAKSEVFLLDVRSPEEFAIASIRGAHLIPLPELQSRMSELPSNQPTVVYCQSGRRSMQAAVLLHASGFRNIKNLTGGIASWQQLPLS